MGKYVVIRYFESPKGYTYQNSDNEEDKARPGDFVVVARGAENEVTIGKVIDESNTDPMFPCKKILAKIKLN